MKKLLSLLAIIVWIFFLLGTIPVYAYHGLLSSYYSSYNDSYNDMESIFSVAGIVFWFLFLLILFKLAKRFFSTTTTKGFSVNNLVVTKYKIDKREDTVIIIEWRKWWLWNWILTKLNMQNKTVFTVNKSDRNIKLENFWLNWYLDFVMGLDKITSIMIWHTRNLTTMIFVWIIIFIIMFNNFLVWLILLIILVIYYFLTKTTYITLVDAWWNSLRVSFWSSAIEWLSLDYDNTKHIEEIITDILNDKQ